MRGRWLILGAWLAAFVMGLTVMSSNGFAQFVIANFDDPNDLDGFIPAAPPDFTSLSYLEHQQVFNSGFQTSGNGAMRVEVGGNSGAFSYAMQLNVGGDPNNPGANSSLWNAFNTVAGEEDEWFLEFDMGIPDNEWFDGLNGGFEGAIFQLNLNVNSDTGLEDLGGFQQSLDVLGNLNLRDGLFHARVPMRNLPVSTGSTFYQLSIGTVGDFEEGPGPEGVDLYFDSFQFVKAPPTKEITLFSWETPDNPSTPAVNEQFEGWGTTGLEGHENSHIQSMRHIDDPNTPGAVTDGDWALQIDRRNQEVGFYWGSTLELDSEGGTLTAVQARIDEIAHMVNKASAVAFDVRFDDTFPNAPTFTRFAVVFNDGAGHWYDAEGIPIGATNIGDRTTYTIQTSIMDDANPPNVLLSEEGLDPGDFLRIGIAANTDGAGVYQIDNFRLIFDLEAADFDADFDVDGNDFLVWQRNAGTAFGADHENGDADNDGDVDGDDLDIWELQYGTVYGLAAPISALVVTVPEPGAVGLFTIGLTTAVARRRRFR